MKNIDVIENLTATANKVIDFERHPLNDMCAPAADYHTMSMVVQGHEVNYMIHLGGYVAVMEHPNTKRRLRKSQSVDLGTFASAEDATAWVQENIKSA